MPEPNGVHTEDTGATAASGEGATQERFPQPPTDVLTILRTFMDTQQRRVNLWKEYEDAMEAHLSSRETLPDQEEQTPQGTQGHYASEAVSLQDPTLMTRIISLVTSGLLDCSHETRTIALQLNDDGSDSESEGQRQSTYRPDMARLIGKIQDTENEVLRCIVKRDTIRRTAKGEERELSAQEQEEVQESTRLVQRLREEKVQELVDEIRAEMTDLQADG